MLTTLNEAGKNTSQQGVVSKDARKIH